MNGKEEKVEEETEEQIEVGEEQNEVKIYSFITFFKTKSFLIRVASGKSSDFPIVSIKIF